MPCFDRAAGPVRGAVRIAVGRDRFDNIREAVAVEAVDRTIQPFKDPEFSRRQAKSCGPEEKTAWHGNFFKGLGLTSGFDRGHDGSFVFKYD